MKRARRRLSVVNLSIAVVILIAATYANATNVIRGCVSKKSGAVRIITSGSCNSNETEVDWNITGPQGPAGPQGPEGEGSSSAYTTSIDNVNLGPSFVAVASLSVPVGSYVTEATIALENRSGTMTAPILCSFGDTTYVMALQPFIGGVNISAGTLSLHSAVTLAAPGSIELECLNNTGQQTSTATIRAARLSAIKVGTLTTQ